MKMFQMSSSARTTVVYVACYLKRRLCVCVSGENGLEPVQMTMALDLENQQPNATEAQEQREI